MKLEKNVGIIGAGSWGIALSVLLNNNGHKVTIWSALPEEIDMLSAEGEIFGADE